MSLVNRIVLITVILACAGAAALLVGWASQPELALLYSRLSPEDAQRIVEKVREQGIAYELRDGGRTVFVEADRVNDLRLNMVGEVQVGGDQPGFGLVEDEGIGASPFRQRNNYYLRLQGELARTIRGIEGVSGARVHVVVPESTAFYGRQSESTATVFLKLKPGYQLTNANVAAVVHLTAGGIPGLKAKDVVVVDGAGRLLSGEGASELAKGASSALGVKSQWDRYFTREVEALLTRVLGPGRASVRVDAAVQLSSSNETVKTYDPDAKVLISEEITSKTVSGKEEDGKTREETASSEYRVTETVKQAMDLPGKVQTLSVAAFVDLAPRKSPEGEEVPGPKLTAAQIEEVIRSALSLKDTDQLKVIETPFAAAPVAAADAMGDGGFFSKDFLLEIARRSSLGLLVIGALVALKIFAGPRKSKGGAELPAGESGAALPGGAETTSAGMLPSGSSDPNALKSQITAALKENPDEVKRLFLSWVESEKGEQT